MRARAELRPTTTPATTAIDLELLITSSHVSNNWPVGLTTSMASLDNARGALAT